MTFNLNSRTRRKIWDGTEVTSVNAENYLDVSTHSNHDGTSMAFSATGVATTTGYVLVDLSDPTNYPHTETGRVDIDWIIVDYLGDNACVGSIEVGFIASITSSNADWHSLAKAHLDKKETERPIQINFNPQHIVCSTAEHLSGGTMFHNDDTTFQDDTALTATCATATPAVGDLICKVTLSAGSVGFALTIGYHTTA